MRLDVDLTGYDFERSLTTNIEIRISKSETNPNVRNFNDQKRILWKSLRLPAFRGPPIFVIWILILFRISDFVLRISVSRDRSES
jgi:hypothetical protein